MNKVKIKQVDSLFLLSYTDLPMASDVLIPSKTQPSSPINVYFYIDIPSIDCYNDVLTNPYAVKGNKKLKLHMMKKEILSLFHVENYLDFEVFNLRISSSGSLRYVETIKFLIEHSVGHIKEKYGQEKKCHVDLEVTPTSLKWFKTYISQPYLDMINFQDIRETSLSSNTAFKEYYCMLNDKFHNRKSTRDTILIVTNSTGVKALLTILSDRPLTSYLSEESLEALNNNTINELERNKQQWQQQNDFVSSGDSSASLDEMSQGNVLEPKLKRNSSSLLSFQDLLITSNKTTNVKTRLRSRSLTERKTYDDDDDNDDDDDDNNEALSFVPQRRLRSLSLSEQPTSTFTVHPIQREPRVASNANLEDEMLSPIENAIKDYTNIYIHDGQFDKTKLVPSEEQEPAIEAMQPLSDNRSGLFSRLTFAQALDGPNATEPEPTPKNSLFNQKLINKSFDEVRNMSGFLASPFANKEVNNLTLGFGGSTSGVDAGPANTEKPKLDIYGEPEPPVVETKKPKFTLDLYGEGDSSGGWFLGSNA